MNFTIEKLKYNDLSKYKDLIDSCFDKSNDIELYKQNYKEDANYIIIVAKDEDKIIGSITFYKIDLFTFTFQPALEIFNVSVLQEYRGKKVAKQIFNYIIEYAKNNNYNSIFLTCLDTATDAHRLYESIGFKRTSSVKYLLNIKDIL